jgi:hypothetical protein
VVGDLDHPELMLPVASFYAHAPTDLVWTRGGEIPDAARDALADRGGDAYLYLVGGTDVLPERLAAELRTYGHVQRLDAADPVAMSQRNADFGDVGCQFSWDSASPGTTSPSSAIQWRRPPSPPPR